MVKLTERLVLARTRASDLDNVRKLNCWASDLSDISIIKKMPNVQIVSLSVNKISSLEDFARCVSLEELYIRKNEISNLAEINYLRKLPRLRVLWLADNPCAVGDRYRMTVLKALPNLQRLDNIPVQEDEVNEAIEQGLDLSQMFDTLRSSKNYSPDCSPVQVRRSKKFREKKISEKSEKKDLDKSERKTPEKSHKKEPERLESTEIESTEKETENDAALDTEETVDTFNTEKDSKIQKEQKVLVLEDGNMEMPAQGKPDTAPIEKDTNTFQTETTESSVEIPAVEGAGDSLDQTDQTELTKTEERESPSAETVSTEGSRASMPETEESEEKSGKDHKDEKTDATGTEDDDDYSDDIEEGEITIDKDVLETNEIRTKLGLKPVPAEKVSQPCQSRPATATRIRNANILQAVLHLVRELDADSLQVVSDLVRSKLDAL